METMVELNHLDFQLLHHPAYYSDLTHQYLLTLFSPQKNAQQKKGIWIWLPYKGLPRCWPNSKGGSKASRVLEYMYNFRKWLCWPIKSNLEWDLCLFIFWKLQSFCNFFQCFFIVESNKTIGLPMRSTASPLIAPHTTPLPVKCFFFHPLHVEVCRTNDYPTNRTFEISIWAVTVTHSARNN